MAMWMTTQRVQEDKYVWVNPGVSVYTTQCVTDYFAQYPFIYRDLQRERKKEEIAAML